MLCAPPVALDSALATALWLLDCGLWPVPITRPDDARDWVRSPGKQPAAGKGWGKVRPTADELETFYRLNPGCGVGVKLGREAGVADLECDGPEGPDTLEDLLGGETWESLGWMAAKGPHVLPGWDERMEGLPPIVENDPRFPGLSLRFGAPEPDGKQYQSVCPPSPTTREEAGRIVAGPPRAWNGVWSLGRLPDGFFVEVRRRLALPKPGQERPEVNGHHGPRANATDGRPSALERASAYLAKCEPSVAGQRGHDKAFKAACKVGPGFDLDPDELFGLLMREFNPRCSPPWSEREIRHKVEEAYRVEARRGWLLDPDAPPKPSNGGKTRVSSPSGSFGGAADWKESEGPAPWGHPRLKPLVDAANFPLDVLPSGLAALCQEGAEALQCPLDFFGAASVVLAGGAIGLSVNLEVKAHYYESAHLYLGMVSPPGSKKTPVYKILTGPLHAIDHDLRDEFRQAMADHEARKRQYEAERKKGSDVAPPEPPIPRQLTLDDTTREAVAQVHSENLRGLVLIKDELTSLVASLDAYRSGKGDDKQFWLKVNSGVLVKVNRRASREPIVIPRTCITIVGGITPGMLPSIKSDGDDGWLDRFIFSYPIPLETRDWSEAEIGPESIEEWRRAVRYLWSRPMVVDDRGRPTPFVVRMDGPARALWAEWIDAHRREQRDEDFPRYLSGPWSKMEGFCARLALILSQLHQAYDPEPGRSPRQVTALDVWGARRLADYFKAHFRRARADLGRRVAMPDDAAALLNWFRVTRRDSFSLRDARKNFPGRFGKDPVALQDAVDWLFRRECIRPVPQPPRTGRPHSPIFEVNPYLHDDGDDDSI